MSRTITVLEVTERIRDSRAWQSNTAAEAYAKRLAVQRERTQKPREVDGWIEYDEPIQGRDGEQIGTRTVRIRFEDEGKSDD